MPRISGLAVVQRVMRVNGRSILEVLGFRDREFRRRKNSSPNRSQKERESPDQILEQVVIICEMTQMRLNLRSFMAAQAALSKIPLPVRYRNRASANRTVRMKDRFLQGTLIPLTIHIQLAIP